MSHTNSLIHESSPYLLQHAHNPVNWLPWSLDALKQAADEDKLVLVSIGYSACHWCHVMERECFENEDVAAVMNKHFINIKVDREERPDVDHTYMTALQLMSGQGGWPLNCFILPDGRAVYGGTYFPKGKWINILENLQDVWKNNREAMFVYAEKLLSGMQSSELPMKLDAHETDFKTIVKNSVKNWKPMLDFDYGGMQRAPKFPMPVNYAFLLKYAFLHSDKELMQQVEFTLNQMAWGGIHDQVGGGFARYSTDLYWKVPHFEKMLYDNAQLLSLYAEAYSATKNELFKETAEKIYSFCERELKSPEAAYYAALDADSEGEEGKFYVWNLAEFDAVCAEYFPIAKEYYNLNAEGFWEHGNYILLRNESDERFAEKMGISLEELKKTITEINTRLLKARSKRVRPGTDDKILCSWNALMLQALTDAYEAFGDEKYADSAKQLTAFLLEKMQDSDGNVWRNFKNGKATIPAFLEDYALLAQAMIGMYEAFFEEKYLYKAKELTEICMIQFYDDEKGFFRFTGHPDQKPVIDKFELNDNVIPSSNAVMAMNLFYLSRYFDKPDWEDMARKMTSSLQKEISHYGSAYALWANLALCFADDFSELVITGEKAEEKRKELAFQYRPNMLLAGSQKASEVPLLVNRFVSGKTLLYRCKNKACDLPEEV